MNRGRAEADMLCATIDRHLDSLRAATLGNGFALDSVRFALASHGRNVIYRIAGSKRWYLKLPRDGSAEAIEREAIGARIVACVLDGSPEYQGRIVRTGSSGAYLLASEIPGTPLNRFLFSRCWQPSTRAAASVNRALQALGTLSAKVHARAQPHVEMAAASTRPFATLSELLSRVTEMDEVTDMIAAWNAQHGRTDNGASFVHGNLRMNNVLHENGRLGFIDFENCGTGAHYQDLSRPIAEVLVSRSVICLPVGRLNRGIIEFLNAYAAVHPYDEQILWDFVRARIGRYYLENVKRSRGTVRIGGLPTSRRRLIRLTRDVMQWPLSRVLAHEA